MPSRSLLSTGEPRTVPPFTNALQPNYPSLTALGETARNSPSPPTVRRSRGAGAEPFSTIARAEALPLPHHAGGDAGPHRRSGARIGRDALLGARHQRLVRGRADRRHLSDPLLRAGQAAPPRRRAG